MSNPSDPPAGMKNYRPIRSDHRARSHDSAHEAVPTDMAPPPEHPLIPRGEAALLTTAEALTELIAHLRSVGSFAYDSEFIGELTYIPKLCLIQVASSQRVALIDPLSSLDLTPFWQLLCDPAVEKVVHAGQQDLEPVFRHLGQSPANIFDTQIAAGFIGMTYPAALSKLVRELTGAFLGKGLTFTHWDKRPLSGMQLRYAADDVRYLPALHAKIIQQLDARGHTAWAREECAALCDPSLYQFDADTQCRRVRGANTLSPPGMAVLRELVIWRNTAARNHNLPPRAFLKDEILVDMARTPVTSVDKLARVRGLPRPIEQTHGNEIVEAIARATTALPAQQPAKRQPEETPTEKFRADSLWTLTESLCLGRGIDPNLVANRQEIGQLYRHLNGQQEEVDVRLLVGWRRQAVGELLLEVAKGTKSLRMAWEQGGLGTKPL